MLGDVLDGLHHAGEELPILLTARREGHSAVAEQRRGHAVPGDGRHLGIPTDLRIEVGMQVDESRCDDMSLGVDFLRAAPRHGSDGRDPVALDGDVGLNRFVADPVDHRAVANHQVMRHLLLPGSQ